MENPSLSNFRYNGILPDDKSENGSNSSRDLSNIQLPTQKNSNSLIEKIEKEETRLMKVGFIKLKPRFSTHILKSNLKAKIKKIKKIPFCNLDIMFYNICRKYYQSERESELTLSAIELYHPLYRLKKKLPNLSPKDSFQVHQVSQNINNYYHQIKLEYHIIKNLVELLSQLAIKWKISKCNKILYRFSSRNGHMKILDLEELTRDLFTVESLWLSIEVENFPKGLGISEETIQFAQIYRQSAAIVLKYLISLNNRDFSEFNSSENLIEKKKELKREIYHSFEPPGSIFKCFRGKKSLENLQLKELLCDFEYACRVFEEKLLEDLIEYSNADLPKGMY
ncbi:unnamed protein product [Blepharisma stoltei]|uniref:Uncharacterized protein n=1 Tax=Blepharisma stoltei TaxID=1481888 RepID=A0AAU9JJL6_9CILI|nr:unnamed protein product [Blepharisma stoltei]